MTTIVSAGRTAAPASLRFSEVPLLVWCLLGIAGLAGMDFFANPERLVTSLGDTDDATRLTQVRALLAGAPWYDTTLARFGGSEPLVSHWSRIVDLPLALMIGLLRQFTSTETAELLTRYLWPLIVLLALLVLLARAAESRSDRIGGVTAVLLAVTAFSALGQFLPGRIDHHNVMILGAAGGILLLAESFSAPRLGWLAGALLGLGTAVGFEALALTVAALAIANLQPLATGRGGMGVARASATFAGTLSALMLATVGPGQLLVPRCDQVSPNLAILALFGAAASVIAHGPLASATWRLRLAVLMGVTLAGVGIYALVEPACLKGPFGQVYPAVVPVWLDYVLESQSIIWLLRTSPAMGLVALLFVLAGLAASASLAWRERTDASFLLLAIGLAAVLLACWQVKFIPYATVLSVVSLAVLPASLASRTRFSPLVVRVLSTVLASQAVMFAVVAPAVEAMGLAQKDKLAALKRVGECLTARSLAPLAALPPGLAVGDIDLGPFLVALTRLDVVAAPYHRIGKAIVDTDLALYGPPEEAERRVRALDADYITVCPGLVIDIIDGVQVSRKGLRHALLEGAAPPWLEPVFFAAETPVKVWRVRK